MKLHIALHSVIAFAALLATALADTPASQVDEEALYMDRYQRAEAARKTRSFTDIYDTMASIKGAETIKALPVARKAPFKAETLALARDYVAQRNSKAFIVLVDGEIVFSHYFNGAGPNTPLVAKSLAKPLSVIAAGRAIQLGFVSGLDQPLSYFFHEWRGTAKEPMTVYDLLSMRSGLKRQSPYNGPKDVMRRAYLHPRHDEIILRDYPLTHEPGSRYDYSNANGELVAPLIERATGVRYADWLSQQIIEPLGAQGGSIWLNRTGGTAHSGCCSLLPAQSWVKLAQLILQRGKWGDRQLLATDFVDAMMEPTAENTFVGMAVYNGRVYARYRGATHPDLGGGTYHSEPYLTDDTYLLDGNGNQVIYIIPSRDLIIARFGDSPTKELGWDNAYLPNLLLAGMEQ